MNCHLREEVKWARVDQVLILGHDHPIIYREILIIDTMITIVYDKEATGHPHFWLPKEMDLGLLGRCDGLELSCANQK